MKKSFKKIKKTRLLFVASIFAQLVSYFASLTMLFKKQKNSANTLAALGLFATICSIALWKHDADGLISEKSSKRAIVKDEDNKDGEEVILDELSEEEIDEMLSSMQFDDDEEFEELDGAFDDLKKAVEELAEQEKTDGEEGEV
jgi:hypothetical protein